MYECWFRPWFDDPGPWEVWELDAQEEAALTALGEDASLATSRRLYDLFGTRAYDLGALDAVERRMGDKPEAEPLFRTALAIAALDYYRARARVPRCEPGGDTNPTNRRRWAELRPYLLGRITQSLASNTVDSLLWRAILGHIPDNWLPAMQIEQQIRREIEQLGEYERVQVTLDLKPPVAGGRTWLRAETEKTVEALRRSLEEGQPVLVEVLRDPHRAPAAAQVVVAYRLEDRGDGSTSIDCYDPALEGESLRLDLRWLPTDVLLRDARSDLPHPAPKALRLFELPAATPPVFGMRRWLRWSPPWRVAWGVKRWLRLLVHRRREK